MRFLSVFFLAAWFSLSATEAAHAGFIFAAIAAVASAVASAFSVTSIVSTLLGIGFKVAASLLTKQKQQKAAVTGTKTEIDVGGDNPASFVMGRYATAGQLVYANTYGKRNGANNAFLVQVIALGDLPRQGLAGLWIYDTKCEIKGFDDPANYDTARGFVLKEFSSDEAEQALWIRYHDGTSTEADAYLIEQFGADADYPWSSDMIGRGVPYIVVTAQFEPTLFSGTPQVLVETNGIPLYDPRKDSSVGGSGSQRWGTPETWVPSSNSIVQVYNVLRGIRFEGEWLWGGQTIGAGQLPLSNWMTAMNACDLAIDLADDKGTEPQFRSGLEVTCDQEPADVIEDILKGCNGRIAEIGGIYKVRVGVPGAPVYSFTDAGIVVTKPQQLDPFPGLQDTTNGAVASYPEPEEKWANKDAPAYYRADFEALDDGRRLTADLTFPYVPYPTQIQRLIQASVNDARRFRQHQITLPPEAWILEPLDVVAWSSARNGYEEKKFEVSELSGGSNFLQTVSLKEVDPADYSWTPATDQKPYAVGWLGTLRPAPQGLTGWQVAPAHISDPGSDRRRPTIAVSYDGGQIDVAEIRVQVRLAGSDALVFDATMPYDGPDDMAYSTILNGVFTPLTGYEARGKYVPRSDRRTLWSGWLAVTTPDEDLGVDFTALIEDVETRLQGVRDELDGVEGTVTQKVTVVADALEAEAKERSEADLAEGALRAADARASGARFLGLALDAAERAAATYLAFQQSRIEVVASYQDVTAGYTQAITAAVLSPGSAVVSELESLRVAISDEVGERTADVNSVRASIVTGDAAEAVERRKLAARMIGRDTPEGSTLDNLTSGIVFDERVARASADAAMAEDITYLMAEVGPQGSASIVDLLRARVENQAGQLTIRSETDRTTAAALLNSALDAAERAALGLETDAKQRAVYATIFAQQRSQIEQADGRIAAQATVQQGFRIDLGTKASQSALTALEGTVTQQGNALSSQQTAVTRLRTDLGTKASTEALDALTTEVDQVDDRVTAQGTRLTTVESRAGEATAGGLMKIDTRAGPSGVSARFSTFVRARATATGSYTEAGFFVDALSDGTSRVSISAKDFLIVNSYAAAGTTPFYYDGTTLFLQNLRLSGNLVVDGSIETGAIADGAISTAYLNTASGTVEKSTTRTMLSRSIVLERAEVLQLIASANLRFQSSTQNDVLYLGRMQLRIGSTIIENVPIVAPILEGYCVWNGTIGANYKHGATAGTVTASLVFVVGSGGSGKSMDINLDRLDGNVTVDVSTMQVLRLKK